MKKAMIIVAAVVTSNVLVYAQAIIPKFGATLTTVAFSEALSAGYEIKNKYGMIVGFDVDFPVNKFLSVQPGLLFHQKGWVEELNTPSFQDEGSYRLNYIEVPVMGKLKYKFIYVLGGVYGAIGIQGMYRYSRVDQGVHTAGHKRIRFKDNLSNPANEYIDNAYDFGVQGGAGIKLFDRIYVEARYGLSFSNLYKAGSGYANDNQSNNKGFQLTIGFPSPRN